MYQQTQSPFLSKEANNNNRRLQKSFKGKQKPKQDLVGHLLLA